MKGVALAAQRSRVHETISGRHAVVLYGKVGHSDTLDGFFTTIGRAEKKSIELPSASVRPFVTYYSQR